MGNFLHRLAKSSGRVVAAVLLLPAIQAMAAEPRSWWQEHLDASSERLTQILGGDPIAWKITATGGRAAEFGLETIDGRPVLVTHGANIVIAGATSYGPDTEIVVRLRMAAVERATVAILQAALQNPGDAKETGLRLSLSGTPVSNTVAWQMSDPLAAGPRAYVSGVYHLRGIGPRSLDWPDHLRKIIEHEMASLPPLEEKWLTVRYQLRPGAFRVYLNDRLLVERTGPEIHVTGVLRLTLGPNVQLAAVRTQPLPPADPLFEPIAIDHHLNASRIGGRAVTRTSLPPPRRLCTVEDVPFVFPEPDARGRDHIDLSRSWLQSGYLEGESPPNTGSVAGRWVGALSENPARIQFRVPKGRYRALHLIAAADSEADRVPIVTVQFYRPSSGAPEQVAARIPALASRSAEAKALPIRLDNGTAARLYLVTIPIDPGMLAWWDDMDVLEMELTKEVRLFRGYPDPSNYSFHGAGLPSSVHVYAMTLERPTADVTLKADAYSHIWTAPARPVYTVAVRNRAGKPRPVNVELAATSFDGTKRLLQKGRILLGATGRETLQKFTLNLTRYGYHDLTLTLRDGDQAWTERRSLALLHEDTRQRGDWQPGRGPIFGFYHWGGAHYTPTGDRQVHVMALAGIESATHLTRGDAGAEQRRIAEQFHMMFYKLFEGHEIYVFSQFMVDLQKMPQEEAEARLLAGLKKIEIQPDAINQPAIVSFFPEPQIGPFSYGNLPSYWGEPDYVLSKEEEARYQAFERAFVLGARLVRKHWPQAICTLPHGDPQFPVIFLRRSQEVRELFDGVTVDIPAFEHLPEKQLHQVALHRMYVCREEYRKAGKTNPVLAMYEGPCFPARPGALTPREQADQAIRWSILLFVYGVDRQLGGWAAHECAGYWGEQHYGGGVLDRIPLETPRPAYCAIATMTRQLNRKNFARWLPTGSLSVFALQFKHYQTGESVHVFWTLRGRRLVTLAVPKGAAITVTDSMDNATVLKEKAGTVTLTADTAPCYVAGLAEPVRITLGEPDHGDAAPADGALRLADLSDGAWQNSTAEDAQYAMNHPYHVRRFPGGMTATVVPAPEPQGGRALAIHLSPPPVERKVMPFYTTLVPRQPIVIPGKASHVGLWVKAASDWGRVVYCLRDAKGQRWLNIGLREAWNCDDPHCSSFFCFDGWRYLRFELPANSPFDTYREAGSSWWGHSGGRDGIVDLPLTLEKIIVERRTHAIYVNDPQPTAPDDVLLAGLYAEYERPADGTPEAVRLARLRMPVPAGVPELGNPIAELARAGVGEPTAVTRITLPDQEADGTRCFVHFTPIEGAKSYDVWVAPYADGRSALKLGMNWTEPGRMIHGLRPETDFYIFVTYVDKDKKPSKPSAAYPIRLKDMFLMK